MALERDHRKAGSGRLATFVFFLDQRPCERLGLIFDSENAKADREAVRERQVLQAAGALLAHVVIMRGLAANDAAQRDEPVEARAGGRALAGLHGIFYRSRDLECAGHHDALMAGARLIERRQSALEKLVGDVSVIARLHDQDVRCSYHQSLPTPSMPRRSTTVRP